MNYRKLPFEKVIEKLKYHKYYGKIMPADYANTGIQLFDYRKFAGQLGVSVDFLKSIGLLQLQDISGWKLIGEPNYLNVLGLKEKIIEEANRA